jgi:hypothetical protein
VGLEAESRHPFLLAQRSGAELSLRALIIASLCVATATVRTPSSLFFIVDWWLLESGDATRTLLPHNVSPNMSSTAAAVATAVVKVPPQGGVLEGGNPVHFDAKNPIILFIVQVCCCVTRDENGVALSASY